MQALIPFQLAKDGRLMYLDPQAVRFMIEEEDYSQKLLRVALGGDEYVFRDAERDGLDRIQKALTLGIDPASHE